MRINPLLTMPMILLLLTLAVATPIKLPTMGTLTISCDKIPYKWIELDCPSCARNDYADPSCRSDCEKEAQKYSLALQDCDNQIFRRMNFTSKAAWKNFGYGLGIVCAIIVILGICKIVYRWLSEGFKCGCCD
jgi:hypothetical protein